MGLLTWFREKHDRQDHLERRLTDNAFAVYVFFPPVLVGIAVLMAPVILPSLLKLLFSRAQEPLLHLGLHRFSAESQG